MRLTGRKRIFESPLSISGLVIHLLLVPQHAPETVVLHEQESLTDELLGMSAALKRNALAMQQGVAQRGAILEETDDSIERNLAMQQQSVKKSKEEYRRYHILQLCVWGTCLGKVGLDAELHCIQGRLGASLILSQCSVNRVLLCQ